MAECIRDPTWICRALKLCIAVKSDLLVDSVRFAEVLVQNMHNVKLTLLFIRGVVFDVFARHCRRYRKSNKTKAKRGQLLHVITQSDIWEKYGIPEHLLSFRLHRSGSSSGLFTGLFSGLFSRAQSEMAATCSSTRWACFRFYTDCKAFRLFIVRESKLISISL